MYPDEDDWVLLVKVLWIRIRIAFHLLATQILTRIIVLWDAFAREGR